MISRLAANRKGIFYILGVHLIVRMIVAACTNFGIDEVYYVSYGLYPDWSFFDHPPMISVLIRLTTLDMFLMDEFFIRLGSVILGSVNVYLIYKMGCLLKDRYTGIVSTLLTCASIYASVITGVFILPDTPQSFFWILALYIFIKHIQSDSDKYLYYFGVAVGFAMLSKYHGVFLWGGAGLYFLTYKYKKLFSRSFILSVVISIIIFSPVIIWNYFNDLSSLNFHSDRVGSGSILPNFKNFFPEFFGQIFYNNPFNVELIVVSIVYFWRNRDWAISKPLAFLMYTGVPLSLLVLGMSMYNGTLPHWSGPGYFGLILVAGVYGSSYLKEKSPKALNRYIWGGQILLGVLLLVAMIQVHTGIIPMGNEKNPTKLGKNDPTLDLYAWDKVGELIDQSLSEEVAKGTLQDDFVVMTHKWFPAGHLDYYYALPHQKQLLVWGDIKAQHIYKRTNVIRGGIQVGQDACFITTSLYYREPKPELTTHFEEVDKEPTVLTVQRGGKEVMYVFIWKMHQLKSELDL